MALYKTEAVVIGGHNWGEADKMLTLFTKERGVTEVAAFGCRRPRSPLAGSTQFFSYVEASLSEGKRVDTLKQCLLLEHYKWFSEDLTVMAYGAFVAEFLREFLPEGQPEPKAFEQFLRILTAFGERNPRVTALAAVLQLMEFTGMQLHYEHCVRCGKSVTEEMFFSLSEGGVLCENCGAGGQAFPLALQKLIIDLRDMDWETNAKLTISGKILSQAEQILLGYLQKLLGRPMKSLSFIQQV